jgi:hypothetical protein
LTKGPISGGTSLTVELALEYKKPHLIINVDDKIVPLMVIDWEEKNKIEILNVAGPRESKVPGIHDRTAQFLKELLGRALSDE